MNALGNLHLMHFPLCEECSTSFYGKGSTTKWEFIGRKVVMQLEPSFPLLGSGYCYSVM